MSATLANFLTLEVQFDESPHFDGLVRSGLMVEDGTLPVSSAPGLGVALDADLVRELEIP